MFGDKGLGIRKEWDNSTWPKGLFEWIPPENGDEEEREEF